MNNVIKGTVITSAVGSHRGGGECSVLRRWPKEQGRIVSRACDRECDARIKRQHGSALLFKQ